MDSRGGHLRNRSILACPLRGAPGEAVRVPGVPEPLGALACSPAPALQELGQRP